MSSKYDKDIIEPMVWNSGLKIMSPKILLDFQVREIAASIQRRVGENEFSALFKGMWKDDGFYVSPEYIIPDQDALISSVKYKEDISKYRYKGYNTIMHSHPFAFNNFSYSDEDSINVHFDCSLLFCKDKIVAATICIRIDEDRKLKIPISDINFTTKDQNIIGIEKIKIIPSEMPKDSQEYYKNYFGLEKND